MTRAFVRFLALLAGLVLAAQSSVAWAIVSFEVDCCASEVGRERRADDHHDDAPACPCPLDCSKGCMGAMTSGIASTPPDVVGSLQLAVPLADQLPSGRPARTDSADILHVPKR